ncbi:MAG TPA: Cof-type HAD-IIB family hydrolase [Ktedonobacteraceae bacterium]|nr:Cof-type HAD-IIB family hydrolase [Ktedonobacteraceae bacterium]
MELPQQQIKLLAIDIDGTLLNPQKQLTPRTLAAVRAAQEAGIIVTLATARRYRNSLQFAHALGIDIPLVTCDGALVIHHPDGTVMHTRPLAASIAQEAVSIMVRHHVQPVVQHINGSIEETWTGHEEFDTPGFTAYFTVFPENVRRMHHTALCMGQPDPLRVVAFASDEQVAGLIPEISNLPCTWDAVKFGNYGCAELAVTHQDCSKASGVLALARYLDIPLEQVMAIGDGTNDIAMLRAVGWGVAMGQAAHPVKAVAQAVTASNAEDGAALAIERYALRCASTQADSNSRKRATCR